MKPSDAKDKATSTQLSLFPEIITIGPNQYEVKMTKPELEITVSKAAKIVGVSPSTIYGWKYEGVLVEGRDFRTPGGRKTIILASCLPRLRNFRITTPRRNRTKKLKSKK